MKQVVKKQQPQQTLQQQRSTICTEIGGMHKSNQTNIRENPINKNKNKGKTRSDERTQRMSSKNSMNADVYKIIYMR